MSNIFKNGLKSRWTAYIVAVLATMLWGTAFPFIKLGYQSFHIDTDDIPTKLLFAGIRFFIAGIMVLLLLLVKEKKLPKLSRNDIIPVGALGLVQTTAQYIFTYIGIGFTSGTNTSVITACSSFFTVLFAPLFFKSDRLTAIKVGGCVLGFAGVLVISWGESSAGSTLFGDIMILFSTICTASGNFISKRLAQGRNPVLITGYQLAIGGAILSIIGLVLGGRLSFSNAESIWILLWLAFVSAAAFSMWTALLKHHPASRISMFNLLVPVLGTVLSGLMLGENVLRIETLLSLLLICAGIMAVNLDINNPRKLIKR